MLQMNEEEGFAEQSPTEYMEYSYSPCLSYKQSYHRTYLNPLKLKPLTKPIITPDVYINNDLQQLLHNQFTATHPTPIYRPNGVLINNTLAFDSAFQSGNLQYVIYRNNSYELYLKPDTNTMTHFQWFYFKVRNKKATNVTLVIKNLLKQKMSYTNGLKPYHRSTAKQHKHYEQIQEKITFSQAQQQSEPQFFELSFEYYFDLSNDEVQFCSQPPYSYSKFCKIYKSVPFHRIQISRTVLGNKIQAFLLNENSNSNVIVVAMARQHPGESVGSWLMQGFVNRLVQSHNNFTWILIPMVNIDGVILGNNRTGVQGFDFNRHWYIDQETNRYHLFPQLKGITSFFARKKREYAKKIKIFIDFHGHSSQQNVFSYGPPHHKSSQLYDLCKLFPYLISKCNPNFQLSQCSYNLQPYKKGCSRYIFLNKFGFSYSYTIQSSFGIYRKKKVNQKDLLKMGEDILISVIDFANLLTESDQKQKSSTLLKEILIKMNEQVRSHTKDEAYDSDSENQDQNSPIRRQFQQKLMMILTKEAQQLQGTLFDKLVRKRDNNSYLQKKRRITKANGSAAVTRNDQKQRMRTEECRKSPQIDDPNAHLPKVKWEQRKTRSSKKNVVNLCDLDRLSLQQMKERLMKMKHSQLGRRILIINSHQNS